jgi:hypothetical protein
MGSTKFKDLESVNPLLQLKVPENNIRANFEAQLQLNEQSFKTKQGLIL